MSDERPRKSWKEIDQARDGSRTRRDEPSGRRPSPRSQKSYRAALDRAFNSGKIGELVQERELPEDSPDANRIKLMRAITEAEDRPTITKAADAFLEQFELPKDADVLAKVVQHKKPARQIQAMELLESLLDEQQPKRIRALIGALKLIRDTADDPEMEQLSARLIERLE